MGLGAGNEKQFKTAFDTLHSFGYFVPEMAEALTGAGLRPGRMCYFAGRSAAMGAVGPEVVAATFYNFNLEVIARAIPRAWTLATPEQVVEARFAGEIEERGDGGPEDVGVEDAGADSAAGECERQVYCKSR